MKAETQMLGVQVVAHDHMTGEWRGWHELQGSDTSPDYFFYHGALSVGRHSAAMDVSQACAWYGNSTSAGLAPPCGLHICCKDHRFLEYVAALEKLTLGFN